MELALRSRVHWNGTSILSEAGMLSGSRRQLKGRLGEPPDAAALVAKGLDSLRVRVSLFGSRPTRRPA